MSRSALSFVNKGSHLLKPNHLPHHSQQLHLLSNRAFSPLLISSSSTFLSSSSPSSLSIYSSYRSFSTPVTANQTSVDETEETHDDFKTKRKVVSDPTEAAKAIIQQDVTSNPVFLYMKGNPSSPRCGFSANVVRILQHYRIPFSSRDVLEDEALRAAVKQYSDWPTLPQLYVKGEFIGGSDIITQLFKTGELEKILKAAVQGLEELEGTEGLGQRGEAQVEAEAETGQAKKGQTQTAQTKTTATTAQ